jgi:hypothetical protein
MAEVTLTLTEATATVTTTMAVASATTALTSVAAKPKATLTLAGGYEPKATLTLAGGCSAADANTAVATTNTTTNKDNVPENNLNVLTNISQLCISDTSPTTNMAEKMDTSGNKDPLLKEIDAITGHDDLIQDIMAGFEQTRSKKKKIKEIEQQEAAEQAASGTEKKTYAKAMQVQQDLRVTIHASRHTKQPLTIPQYQEISQVIVEKCSAALIAKFTLGDAAPDINCTVHSLDQESRGLPVTPISQISHTWLIKIINELDIDGVRFRAWGLGEEPETFALQLYLNEHYNSLSTEQIKLLLINLNPKISDDFVIEDFTEAKDRRENDKGRVFSVIGDGDFKEYCEARNYQLAFAGGPVSCITEAERLKRLMAKNKPRNAANAAAGGTATDTNSAKTSAYGRTVANGPYRIPKKK